MSGLEWTYSKKYDLVVTCVDCEYYDDCPDIPENARICRYFHLKGNPTQEKKGFDELEYTRDRFIKTNLAIENHAKDGSALEGCTCLQGKHFYELEEYSEEGITIADREKEKEFYRKVAPLARQLRKSVIDQSFDFPKEITVDKEGKTEKGFVHLNPHGRLYLPHGLTECEKKHPSVAHKLAACIAEIEEKEDCRPPYTDCAVNPVAVCRASVVCP